MDYKDFQLDIDSLSVHCRQLGQGKDCVLLHGWGYASELLMPLAEHLARYLRVTLIDLPGHGKTSEPARPYSIEDFASVVAAVCEKTGIKKAFFWGHSNGGRTIIAMSRKYSSLFERIVLCDASGIRPKRGIKYYSKVWSYKLAKAVLKLPFFTQRQRERLANGRGSADYRVLSPVMKATFSRIVGEDLTPQLKDIRVPTLLIWGENDADTPLYMGRIMEKEIPDAALVLYPQKGHYAFAEDYPKTLAILDSFFA